MSASRLLRTLCVSLLLAGCAEQVTTPPSSEARAPQFVRWAPNSATAFGFEGANQIGSRRGRVLVPTPPAADRASSATGSTAQLTWSHTVGTGANRLLVVGVAIRNAGKTVTGVSYAGRPLTFVQARNNHDGAVRVEQWYLVAPPSGTGTVAVTLSGGTKVVGGALSMTGADQVSPFRGLASQGSTDTGTDNPMVADSSGVGELVVTAVATDGAAGKSLAPLTGQAQAWKLYYGTSSGDVTGGGSSTVGATQLIVGWSKDRISKWAIAAVAVKPAAVVALTQYQATFWAVRGKLRTLQINYAGGNGNSPFLKLTSSDPTYVPGRGTLAVGDSVLVTATVDPASLTVWFEPHQLQFGAPASLQLWYTGAGGDLNADGVVDASDNYIENQLLGLWYQADADAPWSPIPASQSTATKSFTASLEHFSGYSVAW